MAYDALEEVKHRNEFYRDGYRKIVVALMLALLIIVGLVGAIFGILATRPTPTYFATTNDGRIISLVPLNQPNLSDQALLQWASNAVISIYSYSFVNYQKVFQDNEQYFTDAGWKAFLNSVKDSNSLSAVIKNKLIVSAVVTGAPVVTNRFLYNNNYTWKVQMPITVTMQGTGSPSTQNFMVTLTITRVSTLDSISGVGISQFVSGQQ
ncbi:MAG: type IVB secretion system apparatus protein IcmL/DotI [Pseudomonadota bacterium]